MAENPRLEVQIGASIADIERALDLVDDSLQDLQDTAGDTKSLTKFEKSLDSLKQSTETVKTELVDAGKTTRGLVSDIKLSSGEIIGSFSKLDGVAGETAEALSGVFSSFAAGGLAGLAVGVLGLIIDQWDNIKQLTGDVLLNLQAVQAALEGNQNVQRSELELEKARLELLQAEGAERGEILKQIEQVRAVTVNAINQQDRITKNLREQLETGKGTAEEIRGIRIALNNSEAAAEGLKLELFNVDQTIENVKDSAVTIAQVLPGAVREVGTAVETINRGIADLGVTAADSLVISDPLTESLKKIKDNATVAFLDLQDLATQGISSFASAIGVALAGGVDGIENAGKLLLGALGDLITQIGQTFIATGTQKLIGESLLAVIGGGAGLIAAGAALVAIGSALGSQSGGGGARGGASGLTGGFATGGTAGVASGGGIPSTSARTPSYSPGQGNAVVFEIAGNKLIGVLNNNVNQNQRLQNPIIR